MAGALPKQELVSIKGGGAAATKNGQYKKRGRSRKEIGAVKIDGAAATRSGQYKKRGRCHSNNWSV